ncbi:MAG: serine hydrolase [Gemmataceae bacterium]|nr:serine hydrolase [Gemmataceae bacterium]
MHQFAIVLALSLAPGRAEDPKPEAVDAATAEALTAFQVPGCAVVVVRGNQTLVLKGYGKRALGGNDPVTPDTLFPLASCTKQFTTTLLAMLVDDGALGWDDLVSKHLPAFKLSDRNANALLSVRDLVTHRTGLGNHDLLWYRTDLTVDEAIRRAEFLPLDYPFRSGYRYNSLTFMAAGRIAAKCGKKAWEELVRDRIAEPLEMKGLYFDSAQLPKDAEVARGHRLTLAGKVEPMAAWAVKEPNPSGSMYATARDLAAWLQFHVADGIAPSGRRIVSVKPLLETRTPQNPIRLDGPAKQLFPDTALMSYAMGWTVNDHRGLKVTAHGGLIDGFRVQLTLVPDRDLGFAVLTNLHDTRLPMALTNTLIDLYCGLKPKDWNGHFRTIADEERDAKKAVLATANPGAKPSLALKDLAGKYAHPAYGAVEVVTEGGKLAATLGPLRFPLEHFAGDVFRVSGGRFEDEFVSFVVKEGKAAGLTLVGTEFKR